MKELFKVWTVLWSIIILLVILFTVLVSCKDDYYSTRKVETNKGIKEIPILRMEVKKDATISAGSSYIYIIIDTKTGNEYMYIDSDESCAVIKLED